MRPGCISRTAATVLVSSRCARSAARASRLELPLGAAAPAICRASSSKQSSRSTADSIREHAAMAEAVSSAEPCATAPLQLNSKTPTALLDACVM
jgi:hypothetical protein